MKLVTAQQMQAAEAAANAGGLSYDAMMENAGRAIAEAIDTEFGAAGRQVLILVGPGNNGGDGLVAARYLSDLGASISLYLWKRPDLEDDLNWQRLRGHAIPAFQLTEDSQYQQLTELIAQSAIVIDALLGTGVSRLIGGDLAEMLKHIRRRIDLRRTSDRSALDQPGLIDQPDVADQPSLVDPIDPPNIPEIGPAIVAVDMPSGLHADTGQLDPLTLPADLTVTFAAPKRGHILFPGPDYVGHLLIANIGIAPDYLPSDAPTLATPALMTGWLPERPNSGHKGTFGKALIVSGCGNYTGAPALSARAAYRSGAGLVTVALPAPIHPIVATNLVEATYLSLPHQDSAIAAPAAKILKKTLAGYQAMLVGPGLGQAEVTAQFVDELLTSLAEWSAEEEKDPLPAIVFDADALNLLAKQPVWWDRLPADSILTPHPGEMSRLTGLSIAEIEANRLELVAEMAQRWKVTVVFKGAFTVVAAATGEVVVMPFANPALATAGSGDVLAGCIIGLLAQGVDPFEGAVSGAYLHGLAGELAREKYWQAGVMAGDLPPLLPLALRELQG